ncbi:MAG: hypothetical protein D6784_08500 [Chloroflexi bacterium]|nr:MAG: hypothetical protein D6784_08500 [Chloroflexota bacterium]
MTQSVPSLLSTTWMRRAAGVWRRLAAAETTLVLLGLILLVALAGWMLPQPSAPVSADAWTASLPAWLQPWGGLLYMLGFYRLFRSPWFWLPAALLLLNCLLALADTLPPALRRGRGLAPPVDRPFPRARRAGHVVRLGQSPDEQLLALQTALAGEGFRAFVSAPARTVVMGRRRLGWLARSLVYLGLLVWLVALPFSQRGLHFQRLTLLPHTPRSVAGLNGTLKLGLVFRDDQPQEALIYHPADPQQAALAFVGPPQRGLWLNRTLLLPIDAPAVVTVEAGGTAHPRRLIPLQEDLPPAEILHLPLSDPQQAQYFLIPDARLTVQVAPAASDPDAGFSVQIRRQGETTASDSRTVRSGETFTVDGLPITLTRNHALTVLVYRDPAGWLYPLGLALVALGLGLSWLWRPALVWLIPEVKGLGGQLYGVVETLGPVEPLHSLLVDIMENDRAGGREVEG